MGTSLTAVTLHLHRAESTGVLADALGELLATPLADPFAEEVVVVPAKGIERWLSQRLSHRLGTGPDSGAGAGVCAGVSFRSPRSLVAEILGVEEDDRWSPDALVWPLLQVVDAHLGEDWCRALSLHLGHGEQGEDAELRRGRRYAVARRLAGLFASYAAQRPALLEDWESGRDTDGSGPGAELAPDLSWQAELWRRLVAAVPAPSPVARLATTCAVLREDPDATPLPSRLSLFGHTRLPAAEARLLQSLATHREVHLWLPHPSPALWEELTGVVGVVARRDDDSHVAVRHPLLASLGRDLRELERVLLPIVDTDDAAGESRETVGRPEDGRCEPRTSPDRARTLLGWLQADLAGNAAPDPGGRQIEPDDHSVQVHSCHGPARQVEVLREVVLGLLADNPDLEPRDIVVMCPDIEAYAPLVQAAFGLGAGPAGHPGSHPGHRLEVRLADRSLTQTNPLLGVVGQLLDLAGGRAEASRVRDLLSAEPVRRRFGFSESDLETIGDWIDAAGVRWAFDAAHRADYGLADYVQNTWRFGLDRILAGVAVSDDAGRWFGTTLPLDDVASTGIDLAGRLAECLDRIATLADQLSGSHPVGHWTRVLGDAVDQLTEVAWGEEWQLGQVRRELGLAARGGSGADLRLSDVRALLADRLGGRPSRANFRTGTLTVCTMVPMRSVPHRVVCLLGLDDGVFPRAGAVDGDDVLARRPLTGERDPRSEDRQLMLDAILAASEHLVITYSGRNETTGRERPPAVPLGELLDALALTAPGGREQALRDHPLQAFDPRNFNPGSPFSFDTGALAGARARTRERVPIPTLAGVILPERAEDVDLTDLVRFLKDPVGQFLRQRLDIVLPEDTQDAAEPADAIPVELDGLQRWKIGQRMLGDLLAGRSREDALATEWRRGVLPPGRLGWRIARSLADQAAPLAEVADAARQGRDQRAVDVDVDLGGGRRLRGTVADVYGDRVVTVGFSTLGPKQVLDAWVPLLALCATRPTVPWSSGAVGKARGRAQDGHARATFVSVDEPVGLLTELVRLYDAGLREPLPLPLKTGHTWARFRRKPDLARGYAERDWCRSRYGQENAAPAHVRVWGPGAPFEVLLDPPRPGEEYDGETTRLGALASRLWVPILERQL